MISAVAIAPCGPMIAGRASYHYIRARVGLAGKIFGPARGAVTMSYLAAIQAFAFNFAPPGWARCDGQLLPISQNTALF